MFAAKESAPKSVLPIADGGLRPKAEKPRLHLLSGHLTCSLDPPEHAKGSSDHMDEVHRVAGRGSEPPTSRYRYRVMHCVHAELERSRNQKTNGHPSLMKACSTCHMVMLALLARTIVPAWPRVLLRSQAFLSKLRRMNGDSSSRPPGWGCQISHPEASKLRDVLTHALKHAARSHWALAQARQVVRVVTLRPCTAAMGPSWTLERAMMSRAGLNARGSSCPNDAYLAAAKVVCS